MSRTVLTKDAAPGTRSTTGKVLTQAVWDAVNGNRFKASGRDLLIAQNTDSASHTVTVTSTADPYGRTGNIAAFALAAGEIGVFGPFGTDGWIESDGYIWVDANDATVKFSVVSLP